MVLPDTLQMQVTRAAMPAQHLRRAQVFARAECQTEASTGAVKLETNLPTAFHGWHCATIVPQVCCTQPRLQMRQLVLSSQHGGIYPCFPQTWVRVRYASSCMHAARQVAGIDLEAADTADKGWVDERGASGRL